VEHVTHVTAVGCNGSYIGGVRRGWLALAVILLTAACGAVGEGVAAALDPPGISLAQAPVEEVVLGNGVELLLLQVPLEGRVSLPDWPVGLGRRARVNLQRHEVYAPDARIYAVTPTGTQEIPRSPRHYFWGTVEGEPGKGVVVSVDPSTGSLAGEVVTAAGTVHMASYPRDPSRLRVVDVGADLRRRGVELSSSCTADERPQKVPIEAAFADALGPEFSLPTTHTATIAVDTDNEFMNLKFGDDTGAATSYIAALFAAMNVFYERDLNVRLLQGTTYLRVSSQPDPYVETDINNQLDEFTSYWAAHYGSVDRALATLLSGKSPSPNSTIGVAWLDVLCEKTHGYSVIQVFRFAQQTASYDAPVVGHELGHNFGSPHTHCYSPPIDQCFNQESGCYSGATSCPSPQTINGVPNVRGTIMSYCHLLGGCDQSAVFHPTVEALIDTRTTANIGVCIFPLSPPDTTPPTIANVSVLPRLAAPGQGFQISADASDSSGIASVTAFVRDPGHALVATLPMTHVAGDTYRVTWDSTGAVPQVYTVDIQAVDASSSANQATVADADSFEVRAGFLCDLVLTGQTVTTSTTWEACNSITAGDPAQPFAVVSPGHATLRAGVRVVLRNGVSVGSGAALTLGTDPELVPPS